MALVTLADAKRHLRIDGDDQNADVLQKVEAASAAVLRHVKGRRIVVTELTASSTVATATTAVPHDLTTGDTVTVWGTVQPEYNGDFTVTVTDDTTFTYTVAGSPESPATGYIGLSTAQTWTAATVPVDVQHAVLLLLTEMYEQRGDSSDGGAASAVDRLLSPYRVPTMV
jgi:hypothetical protein